MTFYPGSHWGEVKAKSKLKFPSQRHDNWALKWAVFTGRCQVPGAGERLCSDRHPKGQRKNVASHRKGSLGSGLGSIEKRRKEQLFTALMPQDQFPGRKEAPLQD